MNPEMVDTSDLESWLKTALLAGSVVLVAKIVTSVLLLNASFSLSSDDAVSTRSVSDALGFLMQIDAYVWIGLMSIIALTSLFYLRWLYHAVGNAEVILGNELDIRPGWAVFWHFVPFMNLKYPPNIMRAILVSSAVKRQDRGEDLLSDVGFWWYPLAGAAITGFVVMRMFGSPETVGELQVIHYSWIVSGVLLLASAYFLSKLVDLIAFFQRELDLLPEEERNAVRKVLDEPLFKDEES